MILSIKESKEVKKA